MPFAPLFTQAQLEIALGGADRLRQLAKASGPADPVLAAFVVEVQKAASGNVYAILQVAFDPHDPTFAGADYVQEQAVTIGTYWAWHKGTGGVGIPDEIKTARAEAEADLEKKREGLGALGTDADPASNAGANLVDIVDDTTRILRRNTGGFC